jgi:MFS transporter, PPP family, 3-phenylpropionic acid transporter
MKLSEAALLRILYFLVFCCTASWLPVLADYCKEKNLGGTQTSIILSITPVMMFAVQPLYGMLADKWGYKITIIAASFFSAISYLGYLHDGGFAWLAGITTAMSLFYNTLQPVLDSMALRLAEKNPKFSYGTLRVAGAAGWAITGIITGQVIDAIDINMIFVVSFVTMILAFLFSFLLQKDEPVKKQVADAGYRHLGKVIRNPQLLLLLFCVFIISTGATAIWNFYSTYMKENGASATLVGYGLSFQGLCELPLFFFSAVIIKKFGLKTTLIITVLATSVRMVLYSVIQIPEASIPVELLHGLSWSLFWVACVEYVNRMIDTRWLATGQSLLYAAYFGAGAVAGNFWVGYLADSGMSIANIFLVNAGIVLGVVAVLFLFMQKPMAANDISRQRSLQ